LIFVEHDHVITKGRSTREENILVTPEELDQEGVGCYEVERGGDVTYHGPGQLVGYPIFKLEKGLISVRPFVAKIEIALVDAMKEFGIDAYASMRMQRGQPVGVWVGQDKRAAIGVAIKRWVSFHGFALNVSPELDMFSLIVPCGLKDKGIISMEKVLGKKPDFNQVKERVRSAFESVFEIQFTERDMEEF
jgi:lipoyl(octanoyl) transferase